MNLKRRTGLMLVSLRGGSGSASSSTTSGVFCDVPTLNFPSSLYLRTHQYFDCWQSTCVGVSVRDTLGPLCRTQAIPSKLRGPGPLLPRLGRECYCPREHCTSF